MSAKNKYIPGVCNIGPAEIRMRRWTGHTGLIVTVLLFVYYAVATTAPTERLWIFVPSTIAAIGYLQARMHFCAQFGLIGVFNVSNDFSKRESVDQRAFRRKDQKKALLIIVLSLAAGITTAFLAVLMPF